MSPGVLESLEGRLPLDILGELVDEARSKFGIERH
jgi:hypothetical protein